MIIKLALTVLLLGISSGLVLESDGLVEFKKYKVINSPKVCGDKLCSEIDEKRSKQGLSTRDIKICGDIPCYMVTEKSIDKDISKPFEQLRAGIELDLIQCVDGQELVIKRATSLPYCVEAKNVEKIRDRGWALSEKEQEDIFKKLSDAKTKDKTDAVNTLDSLLNITHKEINGQRYLMFDGHGWHRLHNVEITITGDGFDESVRTKTDSRGYLSMPWAVPDTVGGKMYSVLASDGIHKFEIDIPILPKP